jgi:hypothetical protein
MKLYQFICPTCRRISVEGNLDRTPYCDLCQIEMGRKYSFSVGKSMHEHFNHSVGQYISNKRNFTDALKRKSEEMWEKNGIETRYTPVDITERESLGVTDANED